jgi:hypothetical protein
MRTHFRKLLALLSLALAVWPMASLAGPPVLNSSAAVYTFTDCAAGGSGSQSIVPGAYLITVTGENSWVCTAATCASGGTLLPLGFAGVMQVGQPGTSQAVSCRSTGSTGDVQFSRAN